MIKFHQTIIAWFALSLLWAATAVAEYEFTPPPTDVIDGLEVKFMVLSEEVIRLEPLPEHPRMAWLPTKLEVGEAPVPGSGFDPRVMEAARNGINIYNLNEGDHEVTFSFIPQGKGAITPPPVPIVIGGQRILLRLPKLTVSENTNAGGTEMLTVWNGSRHQPKSLRIGETVDLEILSVMPLEGAASWQARRALPVMQIEPARWYRATVPHLASAKDLRFHRFGRYVYEGSRYPSGDPTSWVQRYKTRFTVLNDDRLKGMVGLTLIDGDSRITHYESIDIPLAPLPPEPEGSFTRTGLLGDCTFDATIEPDEPTSDKPFTITLNVEATGDSKLLQDFDFSRAGFRSIESHQQLLPNATFDRYRGRFTQTLIADGTASTFPAINLLNFDTPSDQWKIHKVTETLRFADLGSAAAEVAPGSVLGAGIQRPILLNLHPATFGVLAAAPLLPMIAALLARQRRKRDPERNERRRQFAELRKQLGKANDEDVPKLLDEEAIPFLRNHCGLPDGASTRELADALESEHGDLAKLLREHADAAFGSSTASPVTKKALAALLAKISFGFLFFFGAMLDVSSADLVQTSLDAAATDFTEARYESAAKRYQELLVEHPDHVALHLNLARARLAGDQLHRARASAHTAVLLDPLDKEARELLNTIHRRLGDPPLPGSAFLALRPDQLLTLAVGGWGLAFAFLAFRRFSPKVPRWPSITCFVIAAIFLACSLWRNSNAYAGDQYMVITEELPREPELGKPSYDFPPLRSGEIIQASIQEDTPSHLRVETTDTSFWLPAAQLQKVW